MCCVTTLCVPSQWGALHKGPFVSPTQSVGSSDCQLPTNELGYKCTLKVTQIFIVFKSYLRPSLLTLLDKYRIMHLKTQSILTIYQNVISEFEKRS